MIRYLMLLSLLTITSCETAYTTRCVWPGTGGGSITQFLEGCPERQEVGSGD